MFSRFGSRLDERTRTMLARGRAVREALKQPQFDPLPASVQIAVLLGATAGLYDNVPSAHIAEASGRIRNLLGKQLPGLAESIEAGEKLSTGDREALLKLAGETISWNPQNP